MQLQLPAGYHYRNDWIVSELADGTEIFRCNFIPHILSATTCSETDTGNPMVTFRLECLGKMVGPVRQLQLTDFRTADLEKCEILCSSSGNTARIGLLQYQLARAQITPDLLQVRPHFTSTGWTTFRERYAYVAGNRLITDTGFVHAGDYTASPELQALSFDIDSKMSAQDAGNYIIDLMLLQSGVSDILVLSMLSAHLHSFLEEAGITPKFVTYLVGASMTKKTTLATLVGNVFGNITGDAPQMVNLMSTTAAIAMRISTLRDCCTIVDDLNCGDSLRDTRAKESRLAEIIRAAGNAAGKDKLSGNRAVSQTPSGSIIVTAEKMLTGFSTVARCFVLYVDAPIQNKGLSNLQKQPLGVATFLFYFLAWCAGNVPFAQNHLRKNFERLRSKYSLCPPGMERLYESHAVLATVLSLLVEYLKTTGAVSDATCMRNLFSTSLKRNLYRQINDLSQLRLSTDSDRFSKLTARLFVKERFELVKKKHFSKRDSGAQSKDFLYLRPDYLLQLIQENCQDRTITEAQIMQEFRRNGLLDMDSSNRSTKKLNGIRVLHIPVARLEDFWHQK